MEVLRLWAESELSAKYLGELKFEFPDESELLKKINQVQGEALNLSKRNLELILVWSEQLTGSIVEYQIIKKVEAALKQIVRMNNEL